MANMKMYILDNGKLMLDRANIIAGNRLATVVDKHPEAEWTEIPVNTFLIDHPDGLVLFDTACDPKGMSDNWPASSKLVSPYEAPEGGYLHERLEQLKVKPEDVKYVVMSHLHTDHAGCLSLFKNAEVFVNETEFTETLKLYALREEKPAYSHSDIEAFLNAKLRWHLLDNTEKEYPLLDGLTIVNFGSGHTFGMLGLLVELPKAGNFLMVADALYTSENAGPPIKFSGLVYDSLGYVATAKFIAKYAKAHNAQVVYGHDKAQSDGMIKSTEGYYD
ncbi:Metallo-beta-lactamase superfamily protein [Sporobacter termitidis DSM 10068]|uniref:Metallo-beta-lactamase superfamily protein n=1 Tax=Sporobacter termitidis DSM 10068 TaxID=1123282 RepID=A0A1M5ZJ29_9FIRM|nr:N-acyl homoserine lactonase family protein [Sporobacter termitidis]SHI23943.1 Metallo-beta-lactamase superfamily protein [Sporobacter termitidis DSM 10068]